MGDILKEAIADAKAVRETALQNAKMALEEAFTPQLKSMLSAKLREDEFEDEEFPAEEDEFGGEEEVPAEFPAEEDEFGGEDEFPAEEGEFGGEDEFPAEEGEFGGEEEVPAEFPAEEDEFGEEPVAETLSINGHTYRLAEEEDEEGEEVYEGEEEEDEDKLDLESIIKELEDELDGEELDESEDGMEGESDQVEGDEQPEHVGGSMDETYEIDTNLLEAEDENDVDDEEGTVEEQSDSSDVGTGDNKVDVADASDEEDPEGAGVHKQEFKESIVAELKEYKQAVRFLKDKLHEVNILNAKLLFTNKLFKNFVLDNSSKMRVVENFDRAQTVREIKLVYATLCESFGNNSKVLRKKSINESASSKSGSTKPRRKIISEESSVANRFKKLAGL